jgi:hypothetical protein
VRLITAHRILITAGIVFFAFYGGLRLRHYFAAGATPDLLHAIVSLTVAVLLLLYYRTLRRWGGPG